MDTARLPEIYLRCKDCIIIKLGGQYCPGAHSEQPQSPQSGECGGRRVCQGSTFFILHCGNPSLRKDNVGFVLFYFVIYNSAVITIRFRRTNWKMNEEIRKTTILYGLLSLILMVAAAYFFTQANVAFIP